MSGSGGGDRGQSIFNVNANVRITDCDLTFHLGVYVSGHFIDLIASVSTSSFLSKSVFSKIYGLIVV